MSILPTGLRSELERVVINARAASETGARAALEALAVHHRAPYSHMGSELRQLRNQLRAKARQLGDRKLPGVAADGVDHQIHHLVAECAYEQWHCMLFARFLAENGLLIDPQEQTAISLTEAEELAKDDGVDLWVFASRCAQRMLPQIFRPDDPLLHVSFATEHRLQLENLLASLSEAVFTASDALGWVYQFWQIKKKAEVNRSELKIGADEIAAVTQLFTEPYMVEFLLHNTLGAWWAGKRLSADDAAAATSERELRRKVALPGVEWDYLRFVRSDDGKEGPWRPAAGTFEGWPKAAADLKVLDPCCGSGHFLVATLRHLVPIRMVEENLSVTEAVDAVLHDNLHGLEIDERCCQIAAFALALAAWTYPEAGCHRALPELQIACTGVAPQATRAEWLELAEKAARKGQMPPKIDLFGKEDSLLSMTLANGLEALYELFSHAPVLGSLIDHRRLPRGLYQADYEALGPLLTEVFKAEANSETRERTIAAAGIVRAAELLDRSYTLVVTNVPYLGRGKQSDKLRTHLEEHFEPGKADLATAFVLRCLGFCAEDGSAAVVTPQNWLLQTTYRRLRELLLKRETLNAVARLGPNAFRDMNWWAAKTALVILSRQTEQTHVMGIDVGGNKQREIKAAMLRGEVPAGITLIPQSKLITNPDSAVAIEPLDYRSLLKEHARCLQGIGTADISRYIQSFWEQATVNETWDFYQMSPRETTGASGCHAVLRWESGSGSLCSSPKARVCGQPAWGKQGLVIGVNNSLPRTRYFGGLFDCTAAVVVPHDDRSLMAITAFVHDDSFLDEVRKVDEGLSVTESSFVKVPFDLPRWQKVATEKYLDDLPEPESDDPTQWLFHGRPEQSTVPLQVAVARLLGYRWPAEEDDTMRLSRRARDLVHRCDRLSRFSKSNGIVCIPPVRGEEPAAEKLMALLSAADISPDRTHQLIGGSDLDEWLRNGFFSEHCKLFHDRPFIWHIWDGRKRDGFHALVNYHMLADGNGNGRKILENVTYSYLGDWIGRQRDEARRDEGGAEDRLAAALELQGCLEAILEGEPPFDLFVRWKPLAEQAIGWEPDINDGVRTNIRPFLARDLRNGRKGAGVLRHAPNVKWTKDRGKEPERPIEGFPWFWEWDGVTTDFGGGTKFDGNRWNGCHYTSRVKRAAREETKRRRMR